MPRTEGIITTDRQAVIGVGRKDTLHGIAPFKKEGETQNATHAVKKGISPGTAPYGRNGGIRRVRGGETGELDKKTGEKSQKEMGEEEEPHRS